MHPARRSPPVAPRGPRARTIAWTLLVAVATLGPGLVPTPADAAPTPETRKPSETYERKRTIRACLEFAASELKARAEADASSEPAVLLLAVDNSPSMAREIEALRAALDAAWAAGPVGMRIGVYGIGSGEYTRPTRLPTGPDGALGTLAFLPVGGAKNLHEGIREAADRLGDAEGGVRAMVLVTKEAGEAEDDVERTRDALLDADAAFYAIAGEAAFERAWTLDFKPRAGLNVAGLTERLNPVPRKRTKQCLYYGSDVAVGLVPYRWEGELAQADFVWVRPPRYPVPSGFGYWSLATLCHATGGRYFVFDFAAARLPKAQRAKRRSFYDFSRLSMMAPDLRPRQRVLKDLQKDPRAQAIVRIWQHLADERAPLVGVRGNLERKGGSLAWRPAAPVRSTSRMRPWFEEMDHVRDAKERVGTRLGLLDQALGWWRTANAKERRTAPGDDPLADRVEADFQLLGVFLRQVSFQLHEAQHALGTIKSLDVTYRRTRIRPRLLVHGLVRPDTGPRLEGDEREARLAEVLLAQKAIVDRYDGTPWALIMRKGRLFTFEKDVHVIEEPKPDRGREERRNGRDGKGKDGKKDQPKPPPRAPSRPPPGPRPGSGTGGPTTGG